jgi:hypothetical protein
VDVDVGAVDVGAVDVGAVNVDVDAVWTWVLGGGASLVVHSLMEEEEK